MRSTAPVKSAPEPASSGGFGRLDAAAAAGLAAFFLYWGLDGIASQGLYTDVAIWGDRALGLLGRRFESPDFLNFGGRSWPLMVYLHGAGGCAENNDRRAQKTLESVVNIGRGPCSTCAILSISTFENLPAIKSNKGESR